MDRMHALDAEFLHLEDGVGHLHIAGMAVFEGSAPEEQQLSALLEAKLHLIPRYRQRVRTVPLELGRPVWVDDPHFRLGYHVRHTALPAPGDEAALCRPDGAADVATARSRTRRSPTHSRGPPRPSRTVRPWCSVPGPSSARMWSTGVSFPERCAIPNGTARAVASAAAGVISFGRNLDSNPPLSIEGSIGPHRAWAHSSVDLGEVKKVGAALSGTVNDVVLAAVTRGYRDLLIHRGEDPGEAAIRTLVPVSVRHDDGEGVPTTESRGCSWSCRSTSPIRSSDSPSFASGWRC